MLHATRKCHNDSPDFCAPRIKAIRMGTLSPSEVVISGTEQQDVSSFKLTSPTVNVSRNTIENIIDKGDIRFTVRDLKFYASISITLITTHRRFNS